MYVNIILNRTKFRVNVIMLLILSIMIARIYVVHILSYNCTEFKKVPLNIEISTTAASACCDQNTCIFSCCEQVVLYSKQEGQGRITICPFSLSCFESSFYPKCIGQSIDRQIWLIFHLVRDFVQLFKNYPVLFFNARFYFLRTHPKPNQNFMHISVIIDTNSSLQFCFVSRQYF